METVDVLVVGAGQAGLATAYWLQQLAPRLSCRVVDGAARVGASWETRWDSLHLFTPRRYSSLPGRLFPPGPGSPTRLEMAAYLRDYASPFDVQLKQPVNRLSVSGGRFLADDLTAGQVVIATGPYTKAHVPSVPLDPAVQQLHSCDYRRPEELPAGDVIVVGGGNSAAQIGLELSRSRRVTVLAGGPVRYLPAQVAGISTYTWLDRFGILDAAADGWVGRRVRQPREAVFGTELRTALRRGELRLLPRRVVSAQGGALRLDDGALVPVETVVWCTGFRPDYPWLDVPGALDGTGAPVHEGGRSPVAGLHWMGLPWQRTLASGIVHGVAADGRTTAERIIAGLP